MLQSYRCLMYLRDKVPLSGLLKSGLQHGYYLQVTRGVCADVENQEQRLAGESDREKQIRAQTRPRRRQPKAT